MKYLPDRPSLEFLAREAKKIKFRHRSGDSSVCRSIGHFDISMHGLTDQQILDAKFSILDAQRVVAREYGFASWSRLSKYIALSKAGLSPLDSSLKQLIQRRHEKQQALLSDVRTKNGDHRTKYEEFRKLALNSTELLNTAFDVHGWPGPNVIGHDCMYAIWSVSVNAVYDANFQKRTIDVASEALPGGGSLGSHFATVQDRYLTLTKRPTVCGIPYGCYYDDNGKFQVLISRVVDPENLEKRRAAAGYISRDEQYVEWAREAKENKWNLHSRSKVMDDLNQLSIDGGYVNH